MSKKDYKQLLSEKQFLQVQRRAFQLTGAHLSAIYYKDNEVVFETVSGTDHKTIWTQRIIITDIDQVNLKKMNFNNLTKLIKKSGLKVHCNCLDASTMIRTERGEIPIPSVTKNDKVLSSDGVWYPVKAVLQSNRDWLVRIEFRNGLTLTLSDQHKVRILVGRKVKLVQAGELMVGMVLFGLKETWEDINAISSFNTWEIKNIQKQVGRVKAYDIALENGPHDFHANGMLVSNCPAFLYWGFKYKAWKDGYGILKEKRRPVVRNPQLQGFVCKHIFNVLSVYPSWSKQFAEKWKIWFKKQEKEDAKLAKKNKKQGGDTNKDLEEALDED